MFYQMMRVIFIRFLYFLLCSYMFMFCHEFPALCPMIVYDGCFPFLVFNSNGRISLYRMSCLVYEYVATCTHFCLLSSGYRLLSFAACHFVFWSPSSIFRLLTFIFR